MSLEQKNAFGGFSNLQTKEIFQITWVFEFTLSVKNPLKLEWYWMKVL